MCIEALLKALLKGLLKAPPNLSKQPMDATDDGDDDEAATRAHALLSLTARAQNAKESKLINQSVSRHELPATASFANLTALHNAVKESNKTIGQFDFVASSGASLVFSSRFNYKPLPPPIEAAGDKSRKRRRDASDAHEERVAGARTRLAKLLPDSVPVAELDAAEGVLTRLLTELRGASHETVVQSFALLSKKLQATDERPSIVLAVRLNAGVAIAVSHLKRALGSCWRDGVLSTNASVQGVTETELPLNDEARASLEYGNAPLLLVTSVPHSSQ